MFRAKTSINKQGKGKEQRDNKRSLKSTLLIKFTTGRMTLKKLRDPSEPIFFICIMEIIILNFQGVFEN